MRATTLTVFLLVAGTAVAQDSDPNSSAYHAIHNPQSPYYNGPRQEPQQQQPPQPTGYWEKTWGAIAPSPVGGILGTAVGASSKQEAERRALADCKTKGGGACLVEIAYHNQCAAMILGEKTYSLARAISVESASEIGIRKCREKNKSCSVYYSACTERIFHNY